MSEIKNHWKNIGNDTSEDVRFQDIFDSTQSIESTISMGFIDFSTRILMPQLYQLIGNPLDKSCLEIGFGGGRLLNAASRFFGKCYGVDIMNKDSQKRVCEFLNKNGANNVELFCRDEIDKIPEKSIDFVYSFIVFQHFESIKEVHYYLNFLKRVLSKNAIGIVYFGLNEHDKNDVYTKPESSAAREMVHHHAATLFLSEEYGKKAVGEYFNVLGGGRTLKKPWTTDASDLSRQFFVVFSNS